MTELEMIKAFARLEGFNCVEMNGIILVARGFACDRLFNPLLPNALNCAARDKYLVSINHDFKFICIKNNTKCGVIYQGIDSIPKAVIECILKSQGLWK